MNDNYHMKSVKQFLSCLALYFFIMTGNTCAFGQQKYNFTAGMGVPEFINLGFGYQVNDQTLVKVTYGIFPFNDDMNTTLNGEIYYHLQGNSQFTTRRMWYIKSWISRTIFDTKEIETVAVYLNLRAGKDFNISKNMGIQLDWGTGFSLNTKSNRKEVRNDSYTEVPSFIIAGSICFFYKFFDSILIQKFVTL